MIGLKNLFFLPKPPQIVPIIAINAFASGWNVSSGHPAGAGAGGGLVSSIELTPMRAMREKQGSVAGPVASHIISRER